MNLIIILLVIVVILVIYCIIYCIIDYTITLEIETFDDQEVPSLIDCQKYPELCYSYQYSNDKYRSYLFSRKEHWNKLNNMRNENRRTWKMREIEAEKQRKFLLELEMQRRKMGRWTLVRECRKILWWKSCKFVMKYIPGS